MRSIAVFCGASEGYLEQYREIAYELGATLAAKSIRIVYGGAKVGLMGALADGALSNGGQVIGVIPDFLQTKEVTHEGLTELVLVNTMHERKIKMHELSNGVITLPGGWGTMDELFEMLTWAQLGLHHKPIGLLNVLGYYEAFQAFMDSMVREGFLAEDVSKILLMSDSIDDLLEQMGQYEAPELPRFINKQTT